MYSAEITQAAKWRSMNPGYFGGWVLLCDGVVTGWKRELKNPETEIPGSLAINEKGEVFIATGGDENQGATGWIKQQE